MLFLLFASAAAPAATPPKASARALIRILAPARASAQDWVSANRRSERPITDEQGRKRHLRTVDFE